VCERHKAIPGGQLGKLIGDIEAVTNSPTLVELKDSIAPACANGDASNDTKKGTQ